MRPGRLSSTCSSVFSTVFLLSNSAALSYSLACLASARGYLKTIHTTKQASDSPSWKNPSPFSIMFIGKTPELYSDVIYSVSCSNSTTCSIMIMMAIEMYNAPFLSLVKRLLVTESLISFFNTFSWF